MRKIIALATVALLTFCTRPAISQAIPPPPVLVNPQVFQPGAKFGGQNVDCSGNTDNTTAMTAALSAGDVEISAGCLVNIPGRHFPGIQPPTSRKILCDNLTVPVPQGASNTAGIVVPNAPNSPSGGWEVFTNWGGVSGNPGEMYGCDIHAFHYPQTHWTYDNPAPNNKLIAAYQGSASNFNYYGNTVTGWTGDVGVITTNQTSATNLPTTWNVSYNNFFGCNLRAIEADAAKNLKFTHNTTLNCGVQSESDVGWVTQILYDHNTMTWDGLMPANCTGSVGVQGSINTGGYICQTPTVGWPCTGSQKVDYSQITFSNNTISGAGSVQACMIVSSSSNPITKAVYISNTCTNHCSESGGPGNPNANHWGAGSNQ